MTPGSPQSHPELLAKRPGDLKSITLLRGLAALIVVLYHVARHVDKAYSAPELILVFGAGNAGVDLFFVISGFIILFIHRRDIGRPERLAHYAGRRCNRVLPLYWVALAITIALGVAGNTPAPSLARLAWDAALLPSVGEPLLGIAWTLQYEAVFYVMFAVLIVNRYVGLLLITGWFAWIVASAIGWSNDQIPGALHGRYAVEFFLGMGAAFWLQQQGGVPAPRMLAGLGGVLFAATLLAESAGWVSSAGLLPRLAFGSSAALLIVGLAASERAGYLAHLSSWRSLLVLGEASYSIYLFQFVFIGTTWQALLLTRLAPRLPHSILFLVLSASALIGGILMSRLIERPLLKASRRISIRPSTFSGSPPG